MGRDCGDLSLYAGICGGAESVIIPEIEFDKDMLCRTILEGKNKGKMHNLIILAEGIGGAFKLQSMLKK